tara:strand:+ start:733 stop:1401 length:669 start_codon:yes stop_codon:yes gene_type:complete
MIDLVIFGSGSHSRVILSEILKMEKYNFLGFIDEEKPANDLVHTINKKNFYSLGKIQEVLKKNKKIHGIIGIGSNFIRRKVYQEIMNINDKFIFENIISPDSIINTLEKIGEGSLIVSGSVINHGTKIGSHCIINTSSSIDHDNEFKDFSSTGPGVNTGGNVSVGENSFLGIGSTIKNNILIGENTVIGANSYINKNCDSNSIYFGSPAEKIRKRKYNEDYL